MEYGNPLLIGVIAVSACSGGTGKAEAPSADATTAADANTQDATIADPTMPDASESELDAAPQDPLLNGCTRATATDLTGQALVVITTLSEWTFSHSACIIVSAGTTVRWEGNFSGHPLGGGETPTINPASPITLAGPGTGETPIDVTLTSGTHPYFCTKHNVSMQGVIYID